MRKASIDHSYIEGMSSPIRGSVDNSMMTQSIFTKSYISPNRNGRTKKGSPSLSGCGSAMTNNLKKHDRIFNNSTTSFGHGEDNMTPMNILEINED